MKQAEYQITDVYSAENFRTEGHRLIDMIAEDLEIAGHRENTKNHQLAAV